MAEKRQGGEGEKKGEKRDGAATQAGARRSRVTADRRGRRKDPARRREVLVVPSAPSLLPRRPLESREERRGEGDPWRRQDPRLDRTCSSRRPTLWSCSSRSDPGTHPTSPWTSSSSSLLPDGDGVPSPSADRHS